MPIYEFRCVDCGKRFATLVGANQDVSHLSCERCDSKNIQKLISKFRVGRSEDDRLDEITNRLEQMGEPESPTEMREFMKEVGHALDEDMSDEMEQVFEEEFAPGLQTGNESTDADVGTPC